MAIFSLFQDRISFAVAIRCGGSAKILVVFWGQKTAQRLIVQWTVAAQETIVPDLGFGRKKYHFFFLQDFWKDRISFPHTIRSCGLAKIPPTFQDHSALMSQLLTVQEMIFLLLNFLNFRLLRHYLSVKVWECRYRYSRREMFDFRSTGFWGECSELVFCVRKTVGNRMPLSSTL